jgi:nicotinamidase-related amidase
MAIWDDVIPRDERELYERGGWGGRVGFGRRPALVVIDMFTAFVDPAYPFSSPGAPECARQIRRLLDEARARGVPVFHTRGQRTTRPVERGRWKTAGVYTPIMDRPEAYQLVPEVAALPEEPVIVKTFPSGFAGTNLLAYLVYHNVDTLIVTGTVTSGCVRDTVLDAFNHNYRVIVPIEAVCDRGQTSHKVTLFDIHMKFGDVLPLSEVLDYLTQVDQGEARIPELSEAR